MFKTVQLRLARTTAIITIAIVSLVVSTIISTAAFAVSTTNLLTSDGGVTVGDDSEPQTTNSEKKLELPPIPEPESADTKYKKKDKKEGSLLKSIGDAIGLLSLDGRTEGEEGVPRRIAVLPAAGQGDDMERDDIRTVIHNNLSSKNFELLKPFDIDRRLAQLAQADGHELSSYDPAELADKLGVEGLIYVDVPLVEKVYAAAYAHYKITIKLSFFSRL
ncbi:MAG: hypothetical protein ACI9FJ_001446, partial [Alteromonadaceae bacterium]